MLYCYYLILCEQNSILGFVRNFLPHVMMFMINGYDQMNVSLHK